MNERHPGDHDAIEATLAHTVPGARGAYMRASFLARRRELLTEWADLLLAGMPPAENLNPRSAAVWVDGTDFCWFTVGVDINGGGRAIKSAKQLERFRLRERRRAFGRVQGSDEPYPWLRQFGIRRLITRQS